MLSAVLVAGLSAGQKAGLLVVAGVFIAFAAVSALVVPSRWPSFPGGAGLRPFLAATAAIFVGMMIAVIFLAREKESAAGEGPKGTAGPAAHVAKVSEVEYKIKLPAGTVQRGGYTFDVKNDGQIQHDLAIKGPGIAGKHTPLISPGQTGRLEVDLKRGTYELYCTVQGHKQLGMDVKLTVT